MKILVLAAASAAALASAASAQFQTPATPGAGHAYAQSAANPAEAGSGERCRLIYGGYYVIALAAPRGAASWDLDLRSPGVSASQGGPLTGASPALTTLSQVVLLHDPTGRGIQTLKSRPVQAELTVKDRRGRTVCRDEIRTRGGPF